MTMDGRGKAAWLLTGSVLLLCAMLPQVRSAEAPTQKHKPLRLCVIDGFFYSYYRLDEAVGYMKGPSLTHCTMRVGRRNGDTPAQSSLDYFPESLEGYDAIVMLDADAHCLGEDGQRRVVEFVRQGGGLVMMGGLYAFGRGRLNGSPLEELLPVELTGTDDLKKAETPLHWVRKAENDITAKMSTGLLADEWYWRIPATLYYHEVRPREGASVLLSGVPLAEPPWQGDIERLPQAPMLVTGTAGKGRVACFMGTPLGIPPQNVVAFWEWPHWPELLQRIVHWSAGRPVDSSAGSSEED